MEEIKKQLKTREQYLLQLKKEKQKALLAVPEGSLRICSRKGKAQFYERRDPKDFNGVYIREKDVSIAKALAQKDYDKKVLRATEEELDAINKYLKVYPKISPEDIYGDLHMERQKLVVPIRETDEQFVANWQKVPYEGKEFFDNDAKYYTALGERVRSKSEIIIADSLSRQEIPYRYECPIYLKGWGKVYPDFTILNVKGRREMYWEHFGMMDDAIYVEKMVQKVALYEKNGIFQGESLIVTYETRNSPINQKQVLKMIHHFLN